MSRHGCQFLTVVRYRSDSAVPSKGSYRFFGLASKALSWRWIFCTGALGRTDEQMEVIVWQGLDCLMSNRGHR